MKYGVITTIIAVFLLLTGTAKAGIFKVEVPTDLEREDVLNATPAVKTRLDSLLREEIRKAPDFANCAAVAFTKNGEIIYRDVKRSGTDGWSDNRLVFEPAGEFLEKPGSWEAAHWHLREVGQPEYNGVYALAEDIFGYPFYPGYLTVTVEWDPSLPPEIEGYYHITNETIYLRQWRNWNIPGWQQDPDWNDDAAVLTRCMLQAFHHAWQATWDHFGSMRRSAWIAIHNRLADDGFELGFNDLYHDDQRDDRPYYKCLDNYNTEGLATRLSNWADHEHSQIDGRIVHWRYGAANYVWWKVNEKQPNFIHDFNGELYRYIQEWPGLPPQDYKTYKEFAEEVYNAGPIEGQNFSSEWFFNQPILRNDHWCDDLCVLAVDRTTARVLAYRRYIDGATGEECEIAHSNAQVYVEKQNWQGIPLHDSVVDVNPGGYGEWDFPIDNPDKGIKVTAEYSLDGGPRISDSRWAIDSDEAYDVDALYGVVTDAFGGDGTVTIKKGGVELGTVPVNECAFRYTPPHPHPGPGEYELTYTPPGRSGFRADYSQRIVKDTASYFTERAYIMDTTPLDADNNGIFDSVELLLAEKFNPYVRMHNQNPMMPQTVDISLDTGCYGRTQIYPYFATWLRPGPGEDMKYVFDQFRKAGFIDTDFVSFGWDEEIIDEETYWPEEYNYWRYEYEEPFDVPHVYFNIFANEGKPVIQYWFFYPYNDWINNHEGDWEHINVRLTSPNPDSAEINEIEFYFHKHRKTLQPDDPELSIIAETHPTVFVGGYGYSPAYGSGHSSGGSYWRAGAFPDVAFWANDTVNPVPEPDPEKNFLPEVFDIVWIGKCGSNPEYWWLSFPGLWGRWGSYYTCLRESNFSEPGPGPWSHECWASYATPGYSEYNPGDSGPVASSRSPVEGAKPVTRDEFAPLPAPTVGYRLTPDVGDRLSPSAGDMVLSDPPGLGGAPGAVSSGFGGDDMPNVSAAAALGCCPNPVATAATITFKLASPSSVKLAVYDLSGRRVATLAEGYYAEGEHAVSWRADVPTGIYLYRLETGDRVATRKVVVAR